MKNEINIILSIFHCYIFVLAVGYQLDMTIAWKSKVKSIVLN